MTFIHRWFGFGRNEDYDNGIRYFENGQYEEAVGSFERCLKTLRDTATVRLASQYLTESLLKLGQSAIHAREFGIAVRHLERAAQIQPSYADVHFQLSLAYQGLEEIQLQKAALQSALRRNPNYARAVLYDGILTYEEGSMAEGLARIEHALELDPGLRNDRHLMAVQYHDAGNPDRAASLWRSLDSLDRADALEHTRLGDAFARESRWAEAAEEYRKALEIEPEFADIRCRFGQALLELDQLEGAFTQLSEAIRINPRYADGHAFLGILLRRQGKREEARECFRRALEINPDHLVAAEELLRRG